jgi:eukaryotic-like serine/threonine-protein kinase
MRAFMSLTPGTKLGPYEIQAPVGAGGMGEVYRARDTRLEREVAIKVLPPSLSSDPNLCQRLEREAKAVSKLSHPHICTLHDIGHQDGMDFLVMELLEGETLEQRLTKGPLSVEQTIRYGAEIAEALAEAHKLRITHRDIKPSNVMLTKSGAKLMDFGLAKQSGPTSLAAVMTETTIEQSKLSSEGLLIGTFQYMAPEQLEGKEADARADIFALGEVMYEMATGKPAFSGKSRASLIASILTSDPPPITQLQPLTPRVLERIVKKCLAKDPEERWQSASDLASELNWIRTEPGASREMPRSDHKLRRVVWVIAALTTAAVATAASYLFFQHFYPDRHFSHRARWIVTPPNMTSFHAIGDSGGPVTVAPDGRRIAFVAADASGKTQLWLRDIDALKAEALPGTEGASWPFWSPDSHSLGFFSHGQLKRMEVTGGPAITLCTVRVARGGSWSPDGTIVFSPHVYGGLYRIPASGGQAVALEKVDPEHDSYRWPYFLPDGKHFLYFAGSHLSISHSHDGLYVGSLDGKVRKFLLHTEANGAYADGHVLYTRDRVLTAQVLDLGRLELLGDPVMVQEGVEEDPTWWLSVFSVSQNGVLAFAPSHETGNQLVWARPDGRRLGTVGEPGQYGILRLSPDGQQVAVEYEQPQHELWLHDLRRNLATQFTFGPSADGYPVWSPDGKQIAFASEHGGHPDLYVKSVLGTQTQEVLLESSAYKYPLDWSPDGNFLLYMSTDASNVDQQLCVLPMRGPRTPRLLLKAPLYDSEGRFSPDMHWIAYDSREQGLQKVFVTPFPRPGPRLRISSAGGVAAVWRKDGAAVAYTDDTGNNLEETEVREVGADLSVGKTRSLPLAMKNPSFMGSPFDIARDGTILFVSRGEESNDQVEVVTNWTEGLKR